jgi:hypothetical protein
MGFARAAEWGKRELTRREAAALETPQARPPRPAPRRRMAVGPLISR